MLIHSSLTLREVYTLSTSADTQMNRPYLFVHHCSPSSEHDDFYIVDAQWYCAENRLSA